MILNSYNLKQSLIMKKRKEQYKNTLSIVPINNMYSLTNNFIKKQTEYVEEIKKVDTSPKKKNRSKKGMPLVLDLSDLDMIDFPKLKAEPEAEAEVNPELEVAPEETEDASDEITETTEDSSEETEPNS